MSALQLVADHSHHAIHLSKTHHTTVEGITRVVSLILIAQHSTAMIYAHRHTGILSLKDAHHHDEVGTTLEMVGFNEIAIRQHISATQMHEMRAIGILAGQSRHIVLYTS